MNEQYAWGKPVEYKGWTFYARRVAVNADKTVVVVNGRQFFALECEAVERRQGAVRAAEVLESLGVTDE